MIIDCHVTIGEHFSGEDATIASYVEEMRRNNIDSAVLCPRKPRSYLLKEANDAIELLEDTTDGKHFYRAFRIDPWRRAETEEEMERRMQNGKFSAAYMHPWEDSYRCNDARVLYVYGLLEKKGIPLIIETGYPWVSHISQLWEIAKLYPALRLLATNAAQLDLSGLSFGNVSEVVKECPNMYLGTSAAVGADWLQEASEDWAKGRVVFTSSYPMFEPHMERFRIDHGYMSEQAKREIYSENAEAFLKRS